MTMQLHVGDHIVYPNAIIMSELAGTVTWLEKHAAKYESPSNPKGLYFEIREVLPYANIATRQTADASGETLYRAAWSPALGEVKSG